MAVTEQNCTATNTNAQACLKDTKQKMMQEELVTEISDTVQARDRPAENPGWKTPLKDLSRTSHSICYSKQNAEYRLTSSYAKWRMGPGKWRTKLRKSWGANPGYNSKNTPEVFLCTSAIQTNKWINKTVIKKVWQCLFLALMIIFPNKCFPPSCEDFSFDMCCTFTLR